jgi:hypothetical protein
MNTSPFILIHTHTWYHETLDLFDYSTKKVLNRSFKITDTSTLFRNRDFCYLPKPDIIIGSSPLLRVSKLGESFQISLVSESYENKMWMVLKDTKSLNSEGFKLSEGTWLKLGRVRLRVSQICINPDREVKEMISSFYGEEGDKVREKGEEGEIEGKTCRICLNDMDFENDPMISPCKCAGTVKFVHYNCLKEWVKNKVTSRITEKGMSYYLKDLICELCKTEIKPVLLNGSSKIHLIAMSQPSNPFIVLEEYSSDRKIKIGMHIMSLNNKQSGNIGRGQDSDLKISDITVSRKHCKITFKENEFFVEDLKSKFGTVVKIHKNFIMSKSSDITVQINRTVIQILYKKPWSFNDCCCCYKKNSAKIYVISNSCSTLAESRNNAIEADSGKGTDIRRENIIA